MNAKMEISKHISSLLKFNECVIIPDFGSFISNYVPSQFDPASNAYLPPAKEIVFNSKITKNDGVLINHVAEAESISYTQAFQAVAKWVSNAFDALNDGEKIELSEIGTLQFDANGSFLFSSSSTSPFAAAYGLTPIGFPKMIRPVYVSSYSERPAVSAVNKRKNALRIAAGIALLVSLSLFPQKIKKELGSIGKSSVNPLEVLTTPATPATKIETEEIEKPIAAEVSQPEKNVAVEVKGNYTLVGGSFSVQENAQSYCSELQKEGNQAEIVLMKDGRHRVIFNAYTTREEALEAMENYRASHPGSQVWVSTR